jgi:hypothetical protein
MQYSITCTLFCDVYLLTQEEYLKHLMSLNFTSVVATKNVTETNYFTADPGILYQNLTLAIFNPSFVDTVNGTLYLGLRFPNIGAAIAISIVAALTLTCVLCCFLACASFQLYRSWGEYMRVNEQ